VEKYEIRVEGSVAHVLTIQEEDGIERVVENEDVPAEYATLLSRAIGCPIRWESPGNDGSPIKWANNGIG